MTPEPNKVDPVIPTAPGGNPEAAGAAVAAQPGAQAPGASLRALREARGWSTADVCARLKFSPRQIEALEAGNWEALPQGPSLRGLVRNYARLLDVPPDTLMQALPSHLQARPAPLARAGGAGAAVAELPPGSTLPGVSGSHRGGGYGWVLVAVFLLAVVGLAAYLFFAWWLPRSEGLELSQEVPMPYVIEAPEAASASGAITAVPTPEVASSVESALPEPTAVPQASNSGMAPLASSEASVQAPLQAPEPTSPTPAASPTGPFVVPGLSPQAVPPAAAEPPPPPAPEPSNQVRFQVQSASWVEVRDADGNVVLSATLQPNETREVEVAPPARVVIGNANGVTLGWQGQDVDLSQHQRGNVARLTLE